MDKDLIGLIIAVIGIIMVIGAIIYGLFLISNVLGFIALGVVLTCGGFALGDNN